MIALEIDSEIISETKCYHCGQRCDDISWFEKKPFCCAGCSAVYDLLKENNLCAYYSLDHHPGIGRKDVNDISYAWMNEEAVRSKLLEFNSTSFAKVTFNVPAIHCISCVWLLENLQKLRKGILRSEVNFTAKTVRIDFNPETVSLGQLASQLAILGYDPYVEEKDTSEIAPFSRKLLTKLVIAGFAFGNIMLLSFPEYLGLDDSNYTLKIFFSYLNIVLAIPALFYSGQDYFVNAWRSFAQKQINIDVPIAFGLTALFLRSIFEIVIDHGPGYLDSLTGLIFFLLIGRWFQEKTYQRLSFERDYKSYFPLSVQTKRGVEWVPVIIQEVKIDDSIQIRNLEVVPADGLLESFSAFVDYSFVTGESNPVKISCGELVFAGGRSIGKPIVIKVTRKSAQSHLTNLWNSPAFQKQPEKQIQRVIDRAAKYFTWAVMAIAVITATTWYIVEPARMWLVLTSVLMVACPCALALAVPFTYGTMLRVFGTNGFYLKNAEVIEQMASIDSVVFDKTGTVTYTKKPTVLFMGELKVDEANWVRSLVRCSAHPLSVIIYGATTGKITQEITQFEEYAGKGIEGYVDDHFIKVGSSAYVGFDGKLISEGTSVFVSIDNHVKGYFFISITVRQNLKQMITRLNTKCKALLSGDDENEHAKMRSVFSSNTEMIFRQSPHQKLAYIEALQIKHKVVMMVGDGLNDAGALKQSNVGVAVTDDTTMFTPACDGIIQGSSLQMLDQFLDLARSSKKILAFGFGLSFFYNAVALTFAVSGYLTPLIAAILMPLSSISVVSFSTFAVRYAANKKLSTHNL